MTEQMVRKGIMRSIVGVEIVGSFGHTLQLECTVCYHHKSPAGIEKHNVTCTSEELFRNVVVIRPLHDYLSTAALIKLFFYYVCFLYKFHSCSYAR